MIRCFCKIEPPGHLILSAIIAILLLSCQFSALAQDTSSTIYLENGSKLNGKIIERDSQKLTLEIVGGNIWVVQYQEVDSITTEIDNSENQFVHHSHYGIESDQYLERRLARNILRNFSLQHSLSYKWTYYLMTGVGTGLYLQNRVTTWPVFAEISGDILSRDVTPYYAIKAGYAFAIGDNIQPENFTRRWKGGFLVHPSFGYKFYIGENGGSLVMNVGYKIQRVESRFEERTGPWGQPVRSKLRYTYRRLTLGLGATF